MYLYLIRHAQSTNNALAEPSERVCDPPLTELGHRQAERLARFLASRRERLRDDAGRERLRGYRFGRLLCSPMCRSLQTAQHLAKALGLAPEVWVPLHERGGVYLNHGGERGIVGYPGKSREEMLAEFPGCVLPEEVTPQGWWFGGREDTVECYSRAQRVAQTLRGWAANAECVALLSHGGFLDALLKALLDTPADDSHFYAHSNTGVSRLDLYVDGGVALRYLNRLEHLPCELVT
ncbi:MAG: histidine phosphatase family protein [Anaerolineae bacterium]|nr:histidine phosphatase family protein [Anaerolineae bacterium]